MVNLKKRTKVKILFLCTVLLLSCSHRPIQDTCFINTKINRGIKDGVELNLEMDTNKLNNIIICFELEKTKNLNEADNIPINVSLEWENGETDNHDILVPLIYDRFVITNKSVVVEEELLQSVKPIGNGKLKVLISTLKEDEIYDNILGIGVKIE